MKIKNIFKKTNNKNVSHNIQKLEKTQLNKIIGGTEEGVRPATGPSVGRPGMDSL